MAQKTFTTKDVTDLVRGQRNINQMQEDIRNLLQQWNKSFLQDSDGHIIERSRFAVELAIVPFEFAGLETYDLVRIRVVLGLHQPRVEGCPARASEPPEGVKDGAEQWQPFSNPLPLDVVQTVYENLHKVLAELVRRFPDAAEYVECLQKAASVQLA